MVRGPRPTKYCCGELKGVPAPEAEVELCRIPGQVHPPGRVVPGLSSGARGNHPYSEGEVTIVRAPPIRVMLWGPRTGAAGQTAGLCVRQLGSQALLFAPQLVIVSQHRFNVPRDHPGVGWYVSNSTPF